MDGYLCSVVVLPPHNQQLCFVQTNHKIQISVDSSLQTPFVDAVVDSLKSCAKLPCTQTKHKTLTSEMKFLTEATQGLQTVRQADSNITTMWIEPKHRLAFYDDNSFVMVRPSSLGPDAGLGVFATKNIPKNTIILEYTGELVNKIDIKKKGLDQPNNRTHTRTATNSGYVIDGRPSKLFDLFWDEETDAIAMVPASHCGSLVNCPVDINTKTKTILFDSGNTNVNWKITKVPRQWKSRMVILEKVFLKTTCDIKQGDEIFVSYGLNYWRLFVQNQKDDWTITNKNHRSHE